ncbi:hypothetical protein C0581_04815 [Candidatus Parcubacteria bacterium]|nr:MAG: hypothetical protein C0581_04815 [Candidatus Parcubacteria bacterium]
MKENNIQKLTLKAQELMHSSSDPIHDIRHVERVVTNVQKLSKELRVHTRERQALELSAWWHDVGRTVTQKPSFVWMLFLDDIISAFALLLYTLRYGILFNGVVSIAIRIILCKSLGTGALLTRILLRKKTRTLLNILKDADSLDVLHVERFETMRYLSQTSFKNEWAFRLLIWLNFHTSVLTMKTKVAQKYVEEILEELIDWVQQHEIYLWHVKQFGEEWVEKTIKNLMRLLDEIHLSNIQYKWS